MRVYATTVYKGMEKEHLLIFACIALGWVEVGPGMVGDVVGVRLSLYTLL